MSRSTDVTLARRAVELAQPLKHPGRLTAIVAGLAIGLPVGRLFVGFDEHWGIIALVLGLIAFVCTALGARSALDADSTHKAVGLAFVSNVLPPTLLCMPTIIGVFYSFPAGVLAFSVVVPLVLVSRSLDVDHPAYRSREALLGAGWLGLSALAMAWLDAASINAFAPPASVASVLPATLAGAGAMALAGYALTRELRGLGVLRRLASEPSELSARPREDGSAEIAWVSRHGEGPHRSARSVEHVAALAPSLGRAALGLVLAAVGFAPFAALALRG